MKQDYYALVAGGTGGIFTSVYDKAGWLVAGDTPPWTPGQLLGLFVFFSLGAGLAWLFEEENRRKAFFLGLGLPAFLTAAQTQAGPAPVDQSALLPGFGVFATAHAQEPVQERPDEPEVEAAADETPAPAAARTLSIEPVADESCPDGTIRFYRGTQEVGAVPLGACGTAVEVPPEATHFGILTDRANPNRFELYEGDALRYELQYEYSFWDDLRGGLGNRNVRAYDVLLTPVPAEEGPPEPDLRRPGV